MEERKKIGRTIGIFDSGVGGLSVWRELLKILPGTRMIYVSDSAWCPYGPRPQREIVARSKAISAFLISQGADVIVVACNTATAASIEVLRESFSIPFIGMEPAVKPAALNSRTGVIGVLATQGTFRGRLYNKTRKEYASDIEVIEQIGSGLVELVEQGRTTGDEPARLISKYVIPMVQKGADHIVLGCTHYPFLKDEIARIAGEGVTIVDPAPAVAKHTLELLDEMGFENMGSAPEYEQTMFYSTGSAENLIRVARNILPSIPEGFFEEKTI
ncbi:MAG: glutamate racemase [Bacteroidetes bacterium HGW-Bacteroidetes-14]|jgi:glutamate racemase|nr:MAG: glutamate racemase [Bacteroidetes bacterium HGW-Bacteroidetes-14]